MTIHPAESMTHRITPHPVLLPMGEGTPELSAAEILAFPLPWGEGQGEGRFAWAYAPPRATRARLA